MNKIQTRHNTVFNRASEKGFSLVVVLMFVGLITSIIVLSMTGQRGAVQRDQARAAGWHLAQVAKAARIYVRDRSLYPDSPFHKTKLSGAGIEIDIDDLRDIGLLPSDFPLTNPLGQSVLIFAANYPVNGNVNNVATVASAYVFLAPNNTTSNHPILMQYVVEGAKQQGLNVNAPIFAGSTSRGETCRGSASFASWDTDCLNLAEYTRITGRADFIQGSVIVPAWRSTTHDSRVVMRFPQPGDSDAATMQTALEMAPVLRNASGDCQGFEQVPDYSKGTWENTTSDYVLDARPNVVRRVYKDEDKIDTSLCAVRTDLAYDMPPPPSGGAAFQPDRRFDLINISQMDAQTIVASPQNSKRFNGGVALGNRETQTRYDMLGAKYQQNEYDFISNATHRNLINSSDNDEVLYVSGNLTTTGNVWATGALSNMEPDEETVQFLHTNGTSGRAIQVDHNIQVKNDLGVSGTANIGGAMANNLENDRSSSKPAKVGGQIVAQTINTDALVVDNNCGEEEQCGFVTKTFDASSSTFDVANANFFSGLSVISGLSGVTVSSDVRDGGSVPGMVVYRLQGKTDIGTNRVTSSGTIVANGNLTVSGTTSLNECHGLSCPKITADPGDVILP